MFFISLFSVMISFLVVIFRLWVNLMEMSDSFQDFLCNDGPQVFDYIVVGAGTAGSIVANRLAENPNITVLLLEAGTSSSYILDIPVLSPLIQRTWHDWAYETVPQNHACFGLEGNVSHWPMGRIIGGTSRLNYMMYVRGHQSDYDLWSEYGNEHWGYFEHVLHYFKKSELQLGAFESDSEYHSKGGYMAVSDLPFVTPLADSILEAAHEIGYPVRDLNGKYQSGFMIPQVSMYKGKRWSSEHGYLGEYVKNNINVLGNAQVTKVLFHSMFEAYGVKAIRFNKMLMFKSRKGVILSAGTIGTPKLLMNSGIGPSEHLESLEIPVVQDLPVGKNLQDHISTGMDLVLLNQTLPLNMQAMTSVTSLWQYLLYGTGPWTTPGCEAVGIIHCNQEESLKSLPDIQIMALPGGISSDYGAHLREAMGIKNEIWDKYFLPLRGQQVASLIPILLHPKSHGEVLLRSKDPSDPPIINPNYLSNEEDVEILYKGILVVKKLIESKAMQKLGAKLYKKSFPGCEQHTFDSNSYWKCYIRHLTLTAYHPVGTCKMGPVSDTSAVVNKNLKVHGMNKLFVIDASIMPSLPSGNINAAVMMIAEKGADCVKEDNAFSFSKRRKVDYFFHNVLQIGKRSDYLKEC